ncbi:MAG: class I SAM-dependent methyltransferase [Dehalococcoidales bacterium]|nr:class I SAM-dependent methyltransferase [Dehalococcoidales bacterium]
MSQEFFNSRAATWDEKIAEKNPSKLRTMIDRLDIKPGASVLDVGTGTGVFVPYLLQKIGRHGKLTCLDFSAEMLKIARAKHFEGNITYLCADIASSGLADESFDTVVCYSVFPHFEDKPKIFREINRLLRREGAVYICHTSSRQAINKIHRGVPEVCDHLFPENEDTRRMLSEAGFTSINISEGKEDYLVSARKTIAHHL